MRNKILAVAFLIGFSALTASANTNYQFTTAASYVSGGTGVVVPGINCPVGGLCIQFADGVDGGTGNALAIQLTYTPNAGIGVASTTDSFGTLQAFCYDTVTSSLNTSCASVALDGDLTITVTQTVPFAMNTGQFIDVLSGNLSYSSGIPTVNFGTTSFIYDDGIATALQYSMQQPVGGYLINNPQTNNATSFQGTITEVASVGLPEPGSFAMMGAGLAGLAMVARRRRKASSKN